MAIFSTVAAQTYGGCPAGSFDNGDGTCLWGDGSTTDQAGNVLQAGSGPAPGITSPLGGGTSMMTAGVAGGPGISTGIGSAIGTAVGEAFGGPVGAIAGGLLGAGAGTAVGNYLGGSTAAGAQLRRKHLNRSTYNLRNGTLVRKGTKLVTNRRRNAGNAKAVRRAASRLAMFNHLSAKVHRELAKLAPHRRTTTYVAPARARGHREGCRCVVCRR